MTAFITSAWGLISASAKLVHGTRQMTEKAQRLLSTDAGLYSGIDSCFRPEDRAIILSLNLRVECLVQPLNTLLLWSIDRDSTVQGIIINALQTVQNVCQFLRRIEVDPKALEVGEFQYLQYYLRELDFACQSVSLALSMVVNQKIQQQGPNWNHYQYPSLDNNFNNNLSNQQGTSSSKSHATSGPELMAGTGTSVSSSDNSKTQANQNFNPGPEDNQNQCQNQIQMQQQQHCHLSPSALLKASKRIQELHRSAGGELCVCLGTLFCKVKGNQLWEAAYPARFKVIQVRNQDYSLRIESLEIEGQSTDQIKLGSAVSNSTVTVTSRSSNAGNAVTVNNNQQTRKNTFQVNRDMPIAIALDFELTNTMRCEPQFETILQENPRLHHGAVLRFSNIVRPQTVFDDETTESFNVVDDSTDNVNPPLSGRQSSSTTATTNAAAATSSNYNDISSESLSESSTDYLFLFDQTSGTMDAGRIKHHLRFTPIEFFYVSRLCAIDSTSNITQQTKTSKSNNWNSSSDATDQPTHLLMPDESLEILLKTSRSASALEIQEKLRQANASRRRRRTGQSQTQSHTQSQTTAVASNTRTTGPGSGIITSNNTDLNSGNFRQSQSPQSQPVQGLNTNSDTTVVTSTNKSTSKRSVAVNLADSDMQVTPVTVPTNVVERSSSSQSGEFRSPQSVKHSSTFLGDPGSGSETH